MVVPDVTTVDDVFGVPGVLESSIGDPGDARGSAKSSNPFGIGSLLSSSLSNL